MHTSFYISRDGKTLGRFSLKQLEALSRRGVLNGTDLAFVDDASEWRPLISILTGDSAIAGSDVHSMFESPRLETIPTDHKAVGVQNPLSSEVKGRSAWPPQSEIREDDRSHATTEAQDEPATPAQLTFIEEACGWVNPEISHREAATLVAQLEAETLAGSPTDDQIRRLSFYGTEFPKWIRHGHALEMIKKHEAAYPDAATAYENWKQTRNRSPFLSQ